MPSLRFVGLALLALCASPLLARDLHVDAQRGRDDGDGSPARPFRIIDPAIKLAQAGDTIRVAPGDYPGCNFHDKRGAPGKPIRLLGTAGPDGQPLSRIDGTRLPLAANHDGINIQRSSHLEIAYFEIIGTGESGRVRTSTRPSRAGIGCHQYAWADGGQWTGGHFAPGQMFRDLHIHHCHIHDFGDWAVFTGAMSEVEVHHCVLAGSRTEHGLYLSNPSGGNRIHHNIVHSNGSSGIQLNATNADEWAPPPYGGVCTSSVIEHNLIFNNGGGWPEQRQRYPGGGGAINLESVRGCVIRNNLLWGNVASGIVLWNGNAGGHGCHFNLIANNTVIQPGRGRAALMINADVRNSYTDNPLIEPYSTVTGNTFLNNLFVHTFHDANGDGSDDTSGRWNNLGCAVAVFGITPHARIAGNLLAGNVLVGRLRANTSDENEQPSFVPLATWLEQVAEGGRAARTTHLTLAQANDLLALGSLLALAAVQEHEGPARALRLQPAPGSALIDAGIDAITNDYARQATAQMLAEDARQHVAQRVPPFNRFNPLPPKLPPWPSWAVPEQWNAPAADLAEQVRPAGSGVDVGAWEWAGQPAAQIAWAPAWMLTAATRGNGPSAEAAAPARAIPERRVPAASTSSSSTTITAPAPSTPSAAPELGQLYPDDLNQLPRPSLPPQRDDEVLILTLLEQEPSIRAVHVDAQASPGGDGSVRRPLRTLAEAWALHQPNQTLLIRLTQGEHRATLGNEDDQAGKRLGLMLVGGYEASFQKRTGRSMIRAEDATRPVLTCNNFALVLLESLEITGGASGVQVLGWEGGRRTALRDCDIHDNGQFTDHQHTAELRTGGGARLTGTRIEVIECRFSHNVGKDFGGGLSIAAGGNAPGEALVRGNEIANNLVVGVTHGGGLSISCNGLVQANVILRNGGNSEWGGERSGVGGGAIAVGGQVTFDRNLIAGNRGHSGGGLHLDEGAVGLVINNLIVANHSSTYAAGVKVDGGTNVASKAVLRHNTIVGNNPGVDPEGVGGQGLDVSGSVVTAANNIFWGNGVTERFYVHDSSGVGAKLDEQDNALCARDGVDAGFVNVEQGDYRLKPDSPLRGRAAAADAALVQAWNGAALKPGAALPVGVVWE